jgi:hypothetical protein
VYSGSRIRSPQNCWNPLSLSWQLMPAGRTSERRIRLPVEGRSRSADRKRRKSSRPSLRTCRHHRSLSALGSAPHICDQGSRRRPVSSNLSAMLGHVRIKMTMRHVHPAEEQKKIAAGKLEAFRVAGIMQAIEKTRALTTFSTTGN